MLTTRKNSSYLNSFYPEMSVFSNGNLKFREFYRNEKVEKTDSGYSISIEIPGFGKEDVSIKVKNHTLNVIVDEEKRYSYKLTDKYDVDNITASADKGILDIFVPFKNPSSQEEEIEIFVD